MILSLSCPEVHDHLCPDGGAEVGAALVVAMAVIFIIALAVYAVRWWVGR